MRKRGAGNTRFAAAFFSPSRASARRESAERETHDSRRLSFSTSRASARCASAEWATCESRCFLSAPRAHPGGAPARSRQRANRGGFPLAPRARPMPARPLPAPSAPRARPRDAPARSGQRTIRGGFFQPLARVREMRKRGAGNARFAAAFFSPSRASARRASAERATRESRRFSSAPRARL